MLIPNIPTARDKTKIKNIKKDGNHKTNTAKNVQ